jgi:DMSO reductase anchor subunit
MRPALPVIFFTVLSGAGYGLWCLLGLALAARIYPLAGAGILVPLAFGFVLVTAGLMASTAHLGRPGRAWRALSQWSSSWLSREGIASLVTYLPVLAIGWLGHAARTDWSIQVAGAWLALCSLATIVCTANIYRSLKTIRAWRMPQVLPLYLGFALLSGGLWLWAWLALASPRPIGLAFPLALLALAVVASVIKTDYWKTADRAPMVTTGHAVGLQHLGRVRAFEGPASEEFYLTHEMVFVLARKHSPRLRKIAIILFAALPVIGIAIALRYGAPWIAPVLAVLCLAGLFVERWLFFAEARHAVAAFFPQQQR